MKTIQFRDFIILQRGFDLPKHSRDEGEYPVIAATGIHGSHSEFKVNPPGVVTGRSGSLGEIVFVERPYWPLNTTLWVKDFKENQPRYVYYFLKTLDLKRFNSGAGVPTLNRNHLDTLVVKIHDRQNQQKIAAILSAYDDLIENNLRRIKILEGMAQTLYREWFVKFRFPGHKKIRKVDSTLGEIPDGWIVCKLGNFISVDKGVSYKGSGLTSDGNPMVNLKNILPNGGFRRDATKPYSGEYKKRHVVCPGDIVLANTDITQAGNVVGSPAIIPDINYGEDILISHHIYAVRIKDETIFPRYFVYHLLLSPEFKGFAKGYAIGTTVLGLAKEGILEYTFAKPPSEITQEFHNSVNPIYTAIENYHKRNDTLRETRDFLLPKLISGELDVSELDITIPEANA